MQNNSSAQIIDSYKLPLWMKRKLEEDFFGLNSIEGYSKKNQAHDIFYIGRDERTYRALSQYAAMVISELRKGEEGEQLDHILMQTMKGEKPGIVFQGLPDDIGGKALFMLGIKAVLSSRQEQRHGYEYNAHAITPHILKRPPIGNHAFHTDVPLPMDNQDRNFVLLGSAQSSPLNPPTVVKWPNSDEYQKIALKADEVLFFNDGQLIHSTGVLTDSDNPILEHSDRLVLRCNIINTNGRESIDHVNFVGALMREAGIPKDKEGLKSGCLKKVI